MKKLTKIPYRRRLEGKTNYKKRLALLKSGSNRLVIRKTNKYILLQVIKYEPKGDKVLYSVSSKDLLKLGWTAGLKSIPSSYLTGLLLGKKIKSKVDALIVDIGVQEKSDRLFAALKGVVDSGVNVPHNSDILPDEKRLAGEHISSYLKTDHKNNQFSKYKNVNFTEMFNKTKQNIESQ